MTTRAALYVRVSTDEQAERFGLASQLTELRAHASAKGYTVAAEFTDDGYSGAELDRPALTRLREAVRGGAFAVVLVHDPDRLARRLAHLLLLMEEIERAKVRLDFLTTPREDTAEGRLLLNVKGVVAEYEREKIRERTMRGKREKARRGLVPAGPTPFGYRQDPATPGRLEPDEAKAATVRMLFRWLVDEQRSIRSMVTELNRLGLRPARGGRWATSSVRRLLTSEHYIGRAYFNRRDRGRPDHWRSAAEWIPIAVPALVDETLFRRAQAQLERNRDRLTGRPPVRLYLLRGLVRCGACGRKYVGVPSHGRRVYRCAGRDRLQGAERCRATTMSADKLEAFVWSTVVDVLRQPEVLRAR